MSKDLHKSNCAVVCTPCTCDLPLEVRSAIQRLFDGDVAGALTALASAPSEVQR